MVTAIQSSMVPPITCWKTTATISGYKVYWSRKFCKSIIKSTWFFLETISDYWTLAMCNHYTILAIIYKCKSFSQLNADFFFSDEVAKFLVGAGIDEEIVSLPQRVLSSPLGPLLKWVPIHYNYSFLLKCVHSLWCFSPVRKD